MRTIYRLGARMRWVWHAYVLGHNAFPAADTYYCAYCTKEWEA